METEIVVAVLTFLGTVTGAWLLHRREASKVKTASEVAVATIYSQMRVDFEKHSEFMRTILADEREQHDLVMAQLEKCLERARKENKDE